MKNSLCLLFYMQFTLSVSSHGGGLNSEGCHNNVERLETIIVIEKNKKLIKKKPQYEKKRNSHSGKYNRKLISNINPILLIQI